MRASPVALLLSAVALTSGCGSESTERSQQHGASPESSASPDPVAETSAAVAERPPSTPAQPLSKVERRRLKMIAGSVDSAIARFDTTVRGCDGWASCVDGAWAVIVADMDWPPYYFQRLGTRSRECEPLAYAAKGVYSFNLAAKQLDYGDPAEVGTPTTRRDRLALVASLRPVPSELRTAAASACR